MYFVLGVLNNITFHADQNVTLIPPSPIPTCMPIRVFGDASDENGKTFNFLI